MLNQRIKRTAILVDGGYYRVRSIDLWDRKSAKDRAEELHKYCMLHISEPSEPRDLYRIFYYDCPPMSRSIQHPFSGNIIDYASQPGSKWSTDFVRYFSEMDRVAIRMGVLAENTASFVLKDDILKKLLAKTITVDDLTDNDFKLEVKQKGVDMRIGLDVASMAYGGYVDQIVLIAGDSDFIPVVKMARKHGVDFILDHMKQKPKHSMIEHVDMVETYTDLI